MKRAINKPAAAAAALEDGEEESDGEPVTYIPVHQRRLLKVKAARASRKKGKVDDAADRDGVDDKEAAPPVAAVSLLDMAIREGRVRDSSLTAAEDHAESVRAEEREIVEASRGHTH